MKGKLSLNQERKDARIGRITLKEKKRLFLNQERKDLRIGRIRQFANKGGTECATGDVSLNVSYEKYKSILST